MKRAFVRVTIVVLITAGVLEIALGLFDPMGIRFLQALDFMHPYYTGDVSAYRLAPGVYDMGDWVATVPKNGTRTIPNSGTEGCRVVFFGDSVEWGWGVNDDETFVDLLARRWPTVQMVDAATIGYNSAQIRLAVEYTPFDLGVYIITWNDAVGALPLGHKAFKIFSGARPDVERIRTIWTECLETYGGPYLFGPLTMADAMYAPVCTRFRTYAVELEPELTAYCERIFEWPLMQEWTEGAMAEPDEIIELEVEF